MPIDFLYPFHFDTDQHEATRRLITSITSIIKQDVRVCVVNTSKTCIYKYIKNVGKIDYLFKPSNKEFNKPLTLNFGAINMVNTDYFFISDVDLVYQPNHVKTIMEIKDKEAGSEPCRIVHMNFNISYAHYSPVFAEHMKKAGFVDPSGRPWSGLAHGNGLIHRPSFYKVCGYDEFYNGYAPEDDDFNQRVKRVCKLIYTDNPSVITAHIFHPRASVKTLQHMDNMRYYEAKMAMLNEKEANKTLTENDLWANKKKQWGVIG